MLLGITGSDSDIQTAIDYLTATEDVIVEEVTVNV